jgi:hypothetical protein
MGSRISSHRVPDRAPSSHGPERDFLPAATSAGAPGFKPTFQECEDTVRTLLDNLVLAVGGAARCAWLG